MNEDTCVAIKESRQPSNMWLTIQPRRRVDELTTMLFTGHGP